MEQYRTPSWDDIAAGSIKAPRRDTRKRHAATVDMQGD